MSRVTQLSRAIPSSLAASPAAAASRASPLLDSTAHAAGASIMPKYADLLSRSGRTAEQHLDSRSITTTHRPTPQPSIANRTRPLMQTFSSSASSSSKHTNTLDATVIPTTSSLSSSATVDSIRVPLLPDNYSAVHAPVSTPLDTPEVTIVASDPDNVIPGSSLAEVASAGGADVVDLGFAHARQQGRDAEDGEGNMLTDLWKGMVDDMFGSAAAKKA